MTRGIEPEQEPDWSRVLRDKKAEFNRWRQKLNPYEAEGTVFEPKKAIDEYLWDQHIQKNDWSR